MKRKLALINIALVALFVWGSWALYGQYEQAEQRFEIFDSSAGTVEPPAIPAPGDAPMVRAASYAPISQRLLFSRDRNSMIEVIVPEQQVTQRPQVPLLAGVVDLGDGPLALMTADPDTAPRWTGIGEKVGEYTLEAVANEKVTLAWNGETVELSQAELAAVKLGRPERQAPNSSPDARKRAAALARERTAARTAENLASSAEIAAKGKYTVGKQLSSGGYSADPNDGAKDGTEHKGYVRRVRATPFGSQHWWDKKEQ